MAGVSYWQLGCDLAMRRQDTYVVSHADHDLVYGIINKAQYKSYYNGFCFGKAQYLKRIQEIEDGKLARSQQGDSNKSPSQDGGIQEKQPQ